MTFGTLALIVAVGLAGPLLALLPTRAAPPIVVGEIAAGVCVGRTGTGTINPAQPTLAFLASIGFALLMFIVGTHLPLRDTRLPGSARRGALAALVSIAGAIALAPVVASVGGLHRPAVIAVLLAAASAAVVLPITQSESPTSALLATVAWVTILDVVTVLAVPLVLATGSRTRAAIGSVLVLVGAALVGFVAPRLRASDAVGTLRAASHRQGFAIDLRVSLLVLFTLAWIAQHFDTTVLIAGFAAGATVAAIGEPRRVADQLIGLGEGFFVPLYFVVLGASIDLRSLVRSSENIKLLVLLTVGGVAVNVVAALVTKIPLSLGLLASARVGVPAAVASIGLASGTLEPGQAAAVIGAAAVSLAIAAVGAIWAGVATPNS